MLPNGCCARECKWVTWTGVGMVALDVDRRGGGRVVLALSARSDRAGQGLLEAKACKRRGWGEIWKAQKRATIGQTSCMRYSQ